MGQKVGISKRNLLAINTFATRPNQLSRSQNLGEKLQKKNMKHYVIAGGIEGQSRLKILSRVLHPETQHFFHRLGITSGMRCLDLGCGGGDVTFELRAIVGQTGQVVGIDLDETIIQLAQRECQQRGFRNVQFKVSNAETWEEDPEYDLAYTRFLLTHLSHPQTVIENLKMSIKSGGLIALEDLEFSGHFCYPKCRAFEQYIELYQQVVKSKGGDPEIGPKLPGMLQKAGFKQVNLNVIQPTFLEHRFSNRNPGLIYC